MALGRKKVSKGNATYWLIFYQNEVGRGAAATYE